MKVIVNKGKERKGKKKNTPNELVKKSYCNLVEFSKANVMDDSRIGF